jgi:hypothetical protein
MIFMNSGRNLNRKKDATLTKNKWLMLFKDMIAVYSYNYTDTINTK